MLPPELYVQPRGRESIAQMRCMVFKSTIYVAEARLSNLFCLPVRATWEEAQELVLLGEDWGHRRSILKDLPAEFTCLQAILRTSSVDGLS